MFSSAPLLNPNAPVANPQLQALYIAYAKLPGNAQRLGLDTKQIQTDALQIECADAIGTACQSLLPSKSGFPGSYNVITKEEVRFIQSALDYLEQHYDLGGQKFNITCKPDLSESYCLEAHLSEDFNQARARAAIARMVHDLRGNAIDKEPAFRMDHKLQHDASTTLYGFNLLKETYIRTGTQTRYMTKQEVAKISSMLNYDLAADLKPTENGMLQYTAKSLEPALRAHKAALESAQSYGAITYLLSLRLAELIHHIPREYSALKAIATQVGDISRHHTFNRGARQDAEGNFAISSTVGPVTAQHLQAVRSLIGDRFPDTKLSIDRKNNTISLPPTEFALFFQRTDALLMKMHDGQYAEAATDLQGYQSAAKTSQWVAQEEQRETRAAARAERRALRLQEPVGSFSQRTGEDRAARECADFEKPFAEMDALIALAGRLEHPDAKQGDGHRTNGSFKLGAHSLAEETMLLELLKPLAGKCGKTIHRNTGAAGTRDYFADVPYDARNAIISTVHKLQKDRAQVMQSWHAGDKDEAVMLQSLLLEELAGLNLPASAVQSLPRVGGKALA